MSEDTDRGAAAAAREYAKPSDEYGPELYVGRYEGFLDGAAWERERMAPLLAAALEWKLRRDLFLEDGDWAADDAVRESAHREAAFNRAEEALDAAVAALAAEGGGGAGD